MNSLQLKLRKQFSFTPLVSIDNKIAKLKKNEFGGLTTKYQTEKDEVEIKIFTLPNELNYKFWFLMSLFFYIVSIFGIFDLPYNRNYYTLEYKGKVKLSENTILDLTMAKPADNIKAISVKDGPFDDNETNIYIFNEKIKKRRRLLIGLKIASWVLIAVGVVLYFVFK